MLPEASIHGVALGNSTPEEYNEMGCAIVAGIEAGWVISEMSFRLFYEFTTSQFFSFFPVGWIQWLIVNMLWKRCNKSIMILFTPKEQKENWFFEWEKKPMNNELLCYYYSCINTLWFSLFYYFLDGTLPWAISATSYCRQASKWRATIEPQGQS